MRRSSRREFCSPSAALTTTLSLVHHPLMSRLFIPSESEEVAPATEAASDHLFASPPFLQPG